MNAKTIVSKGQSKLMAPALSLVWLIISVCVPVSGEDENITLLRQMGSAFHAAIAGRE